MEVAGRGLRLRLRRVQRQTAEQHAQLRVLYAQLRRAVESEDREDAREGFRRYRDAVHAHFALEDGVLFPALHGLDPGRGPELERLAREHDAMLGALLRLGALLDGDAFPRFVAGFESLRGELAEHERREEELVARLTAGSDAD